MNKKLFIIFAAVFGVLIVPALSRADYEISDGSVTDLYNMTPTPCAATVLCDLVGGTNINAFGATTTANPDFGASYAFITGAAYGASSTNNGWWTPSYLVVTSTWTWSEWFKPTADPTGALGGTGFYDLFDNTDGALSITVFYANVGGVTGIQDYYNSCGTGNHNTFIPGGVSSSTYNHLVVKNWGTRFDVYLNGTRIVGENEDISPACNAWTKGFSVGQGNGNWSVAYNHNIQYNQFFLDNTTLPTSTITAIYNSGAGELVCVTPGCAGAPPSPAPFVSFAWPTTGTTTLPFNYFYAKFFNLTSTDQYAVNFSWTLHLNQQSDYQTIYKTGTQLMTQALAIPFNNFPTEILNDNLVSLPMNADISLFDQNTAPIGVGNPVATSDVPFSISAQGNSTSALQLYITIASGTTSSVSISTSSLPTNPFVNRGNSLLAQCGQPPALTDIGGGIAFGLCSVMNELFVPNPSMMTNVQGAFSNVQTDFPFNMVYGTIGNFITAATAAETTGATTTLELPVFSTNIPILTSSSLQDFVGASNKTLIFNTEKNVAWVGVAFTILKIIF